MQRGFHHGLLDATALDVGTSLGPYQVTVKIRQTGVALSCAMPLTPTGVIH